MERKIKEELIRRVSRIVKEKADAREIEVEVGDMLRKKLIDIIQQESGG